MRVTPTDGWSLGRVVAVGLFAIGVAALVIASPASTLIAGAFGRAGSGEPRITTMSGAFGASGRVRLQVRMPGEKFDFPADVSGPDDRRTYIWVKAEDSSAVVEELPMPGKAVKAPLLPGLYHLALPTPSGRRIIDSVIVGVLVPFSEKFGASLNGYRIGRYRWEALGGDASPPPRGFLQVMPEDLDVRISTHLRLRAFVTHDGQDIWPKYVALDPRILDKVELVLKDLDVKDFEMPMDVSSGFRTPVYNRTVPRAAGDSRHQYGDAVDLAVDVDGDGLVTFTDAMAVARAVERVELKHPELVGGLGLYGNRGTSPYVHIDVRGKPSRWRG